MSMTDKQPILMQLN